MTGPRHGYRFHSVWSRLPATPARVYAVLERVEDYPQWWPQIREVLPGDVRTGTVRMRSVLPVDLRVTLRAERRDPEAGILEVALSGDLAGRLRCSVRAEPGGGSRAVFEQYAEVRKPVLGRVAPPLRPLLRANHALMMRAGQRGLRARLRGLEEE